MIRQYHLALAELGKGNPEPVKALFPHRGDVSVAGGFGGVMHGWEQVARNTEFAASRFKGGQAGSVENVVKYATQDLGYIVEIERYEGKVGGREEMGPGGSTCYKHLSARRRDLEARSSPRGPGCFYSGS